MQGTFTKIDFKVKDAIVEALELLDSGPALIAFINGWQGEHESSEVLNWITDWVSAKNAKSE